MRYRKGDELILKVEDDFGYADKTYRSAKVQVIGFNVDCDGPEAEYLVYVPPYVQLANSWTLTKRHANHFQVDPKFIGDSVAFVVARHPIYKHLPAIPGERCDHCKDFFEGATRDGAGAYLCRACQLNPYR
jgi:hypothetical protein